MYRKLYFIGWTGYAGLLLLSFLFFKERMIFLDCSFAIFHMVKEHWFCLPNYRFGDVISQALPVLAIKAKASLQDVSLIFSLTLSLYFAGCFACCGLLLKQYKAALVILFINLLFVTHSFYLPVAQLPQGLAMLVTSIAFLLAAEQNQRKAWLIPAVLCAIIAITFHPLVFFVAVYVLLLLYTDSNRPVALKTLWAAAIVALLIFLLKTFIFRLPYERHSASGLKNLLRLFPNYLSAYSFRTLPRFLLASYYWIALGLAGLATLYIKTKDYRKLVLTGLSVVGYLVLINIMYPGAETPQFYRELMYTPISLMLGWPLAYDLLPALQPRMSVALIALMVSTGLVRIYLAHTPYTAQLNWERGFLAEHGTTKLLANKKQEGVQQLQMNWGTPYEFWQLSTIEQGYSASIIIDDTPQSRAWIRDLNTTFVVNWGLYPYSELDDTLYFKFRDTVSGYTVQPDE